MNTLPKDCIDLISKKMEIQDRINFHIATNKKQIPDKDEKIAIMRIAMKKRKKQSMSSCMIEFLQSNQTDPTIQNIIEQNTTAKNMTSILEHMKKNTLTQSYLNTFEFSYDEAINLDKWISEYASPLQFEMFMQNEHYAKHFKEKHKLSFNTLSVLHGCILRENFDLARHLLQTWEKQGMSKGMFEQDIAFIKTALGTAPCCRDFIWTHIPMTDDEKSDILDRMTDYMDMDGIKKFLKINNI